MQSARERTKQLGCIECCPEDIADIEQALLDSERIGEEREREACAKIAENQLARVSYVTNHYASSIAELIRARNTGQRKE